MDNDRRKIELMNALLLSMSGTPVLYYGDELGMGDNYYLGDRDGVRTPMQWSADRNGGFSRANPQALYLPPIQDPVYGFQAVNVEAQQNETSSLLNWTRRMIGVRKQRKAFGRGALQILYPRNRKILAYVRRFEEENILCVANLSRQAQAVEIDLAEFRGAVPIELLGGAAFPPVGDLPYMLTLPAYGFFWFLLAPEADAPKWHVVTPDPLPEFVTLTAPGGRIDRALEGRELANLERYALPDFLRHQRWYAGKGTATRRTGAVSLGAIPGEPNQLLLATAETDEGEQRYFLPVSVLWGDQNLTFGAPKLSYTLAKVRNGPHLGALIDACHDERFVGELIRAIRAGGDLPATGGTLRFVSTQGFRDLELIGDVHANRRRPEQRLRHHRRCGDAEDVSPATRRRAAGDRGGAVPDRGRRLQEHAALLRQRRIPAGRRAADGARGVVRLRAQSGRRLGRHPRRARAAYRRVRLPAARGDACGAAGRRAGAAGA